MKKEREEEVSGSSSRRNFLKKMGIGVGAASLTGVAGLAGMARLPLARAVGGSHRAPGVR
jgi:hypothetical protein